MAAVEAHPAFRTADTVLLFHALPDEPDTRPLLERWCGRKRLLLPVVTGDDLELRLYEGADSLVIGRFGIAEPVGPVFTDYAAISLALVPGVAFDAAGHRLGRGKRYYDRFLLRIPQARKIGICFAYQLVENVPTEPFDIRMDEVITHTRIHED